MPIQETLETWVLSLGQEDTLEEGMATHSSILAWRIPGIVEPGGLQSMGSQRVRHNLATKYNNNGRYTHYIFVKTYRMHNAISYPYCTLRGLGDNDVSIVQINGLNRCPSLLVSCDNGGGWV